MSVNLSHTIWSLTYLLHTQTRRVSECVGKGYYSATRKTCFFFTPRDLSCTWAHPRIPPASEKQFTFSIWFISQPGQNHPSPAHAQWEITYLGLYASWKTWIYFNFGILSPRPWIPWRFHSNHEKPLKCESAIRLVYNCYGLVGY